MQYSFVLADFYLNMDRSNEHALYHESHGNVAVMFASLTDLSIDESNILADFNEIICEFDKLLFESNFLCRIEKIKLAGSYLTYEGIHYNIVHCYATLINFFLLRYHIHGSLRPGNFKTKFVSELRSK